MRFVVVGADKSHNKSLLLGSWVHVNSHDNRHKNYS